MTSLWTEWYFTCAGVRMACHSESGLFLDPGATEDDIAKEEADRLVAVVNVAVGERQRDVRVARAAC